MTARDDLYGLLGGQQRRVNGERRRLAERAAAAIRARAGGAERFDALAYALTMREVDAELDRLYGRFPGDGAAVFWRAILADAREARRRAFARTRADVRRRLRGEPELLRAIEAEAR